MIEIRQTEYYASWFASLKDRAARARIDVRIRRMSLGNPGDVKPVGSGVSELRIDYGPGYRVYLFSVAKHWLFCWLVETSERKTKISVRRLKWRKFSRS